MSRELVSDCVKCGAKFCWLEHEYQQGPLCPNCGYDTIYNGKRNIDGIDFDLTTEYLCCFCKTNKPDASTAYEVSIDPTANKKTKMPRCKECKEVHSADLLEDSISNGSGFIIGILNVVLFLYIYCLYNKDRLIEMTGCIIFLGGIIFTFLIPLLMVIFLYIKFPMFRYIMIYIISPILVSALTAFFIVAILIGTHILGTKEGMVLSGIKERIPLIFFCVIMIFCSIILILRGIKYKKKIENIRKRLNTQPLDNYKEYLIIKTPFIKNPYQPIIRNFLTGPYCQFKNFAKSALSKKTTAIINFSDLHKLVDFIIEAEKEADLKKDINKFIQQLGERFIFICPNCGILNSQGVMTGLAVKKVEELNPTIHSIYAGPNIAHLASGMCPGCKNTILIIIYDSKLSASSTIL